jgi:hypothetical protein
LASENPDSCDHSALRVPRHLTISEGAEPDQISGLILATGTAVILRLLVACLVYQEGNVSKAKPELPKVITLEEYLKSSPTQDAELEPKKAATSRPTRAKAVPDRRQGARRLPVSAGREKTVAAPAASTAPKRRKKAG